MGLFYRENKPGKGVEKATKIQKPHVRFLKILYRKVWELTKLNLLYLVFIMPTFVIVFFLSGIATNGMFQGMAQEYAVLYEVSVRIVISSFFSVLWGMGPATAGLTNVLIKYVKEEHSFVLSDFWESVKTNFKQSAFVFLMDIIAFVILYAGLVFYGNIPGLSGFVFTVFIVSIILVYTMMHFYIYPILVTYDMELKHVYRNSLIYTIGKLPRTFLTLIILLIIHIGIVFVITHFSIGALLFFLGTAIVHALSGFIVNFNVYENTREYINSTDD